MPLQRLQIRIVKIFAILANRFNLAGFEPGIALLDSLKIGLVEPRQ
jgi:hypothetical protein